MSGGDLVPGWVGSARPVPGGELLQQFECSDVVPSRVLLC